MGNRQWKYVIVSFDNATVEGTDDESVAKEFALSEDFGVIEMATCQSVGQYSDKDGNHERIDVPEQTTYKLTKRTARETYDGTDSDD